MNLLFRRAGLFFVAFLVLFSTAGVAICHHVCGCPPPASALVSVAPETLSCCHRSELSPVSRPVSSAPAETQPAPACCNDRDHSLCNTGYHGRCRDEVLYLKAPIVSTLPAGELTVPAMTFGMTDFRMPDAGSLNASMPEQSFIRRCLIPPRDGGSLIIFLHSIKIPSPEDHC